MPITGPLTWTVLKLAGLLAAGAATCTGLPAAQLWWRASSTEVELGYSAPCEPSPGRFSVMGVEVQRRPERGDSELQRLNETSATGDALRVGSAENHAVARWTAVSVLLGAMATAASTLG